MKRLTFEMGIDPSPAIAGGPPRRDREKKTGMEM